MRRATKAPVKKDESENRRGVREIGRKGGVCGGLTKTDPESVSKRGRRSEIADSVSGDGKAVRAEGKKDKVDQHGSELREGTGERD
jgi:general stress protein YciG